MSESTTLSDLLFEYDERLGDLEEPVVLTLTEKNGFVPQEERFKKRLATEDTSKYKVVRRFDVAYNQYLLWAGAIAQNKDWDSGIVSPAYPTFRVRKGYDPRYVDWLLSGDAIRLNYDAISFGAVPRRRRAKESDFLSIEIPKPPPIAEQKRIAAILDAADALRAKRRRSFAQLDTLLQSTFIDMFGDPVTNPRGWRTEILGNWIDKIESGWSPKCIDRKSLDDEWGVLKLGAVTRCEFNESEQKALPHDLKPRPVIEVHPGDLLFSRKNTYELIAAAAYVHDIRPKLMLSDLIFRLRLKPVAKVDPRFLWQLLIQPRQRNTIQKLAGGAAGSMPNISKAKLKTVRLIKPPLQLQHRFATIVESVGKQKSRLRAHFAELDTLFASLQSRAFNGEL